MDNRLPINEITINEIARLFEKEVKKEQGAFCINLVSRHKKTEVSLSIYLEGNGSGLVSVYTENSHLQLQNCNCVILSEMLSEVIFIVETGEKISGMIISKQGDCSLYANVEKSILSSDFTGLSSEKLISAVALSLTEN